MKKLAASVLMVLCSLNIACSKSKPAKNSFTNDHGMTFVNIPAGEFMMGSPKAEAGRDDDEVQRKVIITKAFYIQTTEVTRGQWKEIAGDDPSAFSECGDECPVDRLKPEWAAFFIDKLNKKNGAYVYRLPTEAEWEYVARAGSQSPFSTGKCLGEKNANYHAGMPYEKCPVGEPLRKPTPVKQYKPNAWGIYGLYGNAWELCSDWYGEYAKGPISDPKGPKEGEFKVIRGGSWGFPEAFSRSANRFKTVRDITGFRLIAEPKPKPVKDPIIPAE